MKKNIEFYNKIAELYGFSEMKKGSPISSYAFYYQDKIRKVVKSLINKGESRLLEVGCGNGMLLNEIINENEQLEIVGLDFSEKMLYIANKNLEKEISINLTMGVAHSLPFRNEYFDVVLCINTISNFPTMEYLDQSITEMIRVCKSDSKIILDIRNKFNPLMYCYLKINSSGELPTQCYSIKGIQNILKFNKYHITKKMPIGFPLAIIAPYIVIEAKSLGHNLDYERSLRSTTKK